MWQNEPLRREMSSWSQCIKQATSLEEQTSTTGCTGQYILLYPGYSPTSLLEMPPFHTETVTDRPETNRKIFHHSHVLSGNISGDICGEFKSANIQNDSTTETNENTHTPQLEQRIDVESQTSSIKETSLQNPEPLRNSSGKLKLLGNNYCASIAPRTLKTKPKKRLTASQVKCNGDDHISLLTKTTSALCGKRL